MNKQPEWYANKANWSNYQKMTAQASKIVEDIKKEFGLDVTEVLELGILHLNDAKKWLVKHLYFKMAKENRTYTEIKYELSVNYDISVSAIEKLIYRK